MKIRLQILVDKAWDRMRKLGTKSSMIRHYKLLRVLEEIEGGLINNKGELSSPHNENLRLFYV